MVGCSIRRLARASLLPMICPCMVIGVVPWQNHGNFVSKALEPRSPKKTLYQTGYAVMNGPSGLFWHFLLGSFVPRQISCLGAKTSKRNQSCWSANLWGETGFAYFHPDGCDEVWHGFFEVYSLTFFSERIQFLKVVQLEWIRKDHQKHETSRCRISCWTAGWFHDAFIAVVRPVSNRSATMILHARHGFLDAVSAVRGCLEVQMSKMGNTTYHVFIFLHY